MANPAVGAIKLSPASQNSNLILTAGIVLILGIMILPIPSFLLDILMALNLTSALVILFVTLFVLRPMDFSVFPGLLLIVTLFRLALNIASTRLILGEAYAGEIIEAFGNFVVQGNYAVGTVIFLILVIINFVVITKGATRIAEVSARFTLDAMPGKQMSIDADLNAGLIDDLQAQQRRETIAKEADFYGAMDGASKFVRGDAIAGLLITAVNMLGGLLIGVLQKGLPAGEAAGLYTLLTVGDGLVAQIPALIISTAAGIVITRASSMSTLGADIAKQVIGQPKAIYAASGVLGLMGVLPGLPFVPFMILAIGLFFLGNYVSNYQKKEQDEAEAAEAEEVEEVEEVERIESFLHPDAFEIEIGYGLIPLVDENQGGNLLNRITTIRKSLAIEMGILVPAIRIRDNIQLKASEYIFKIYGIEVARGEVMMDYFMVVNPDERLELTGIEMTEPTFGLPAIWVSEQEREKAELLGNTVVEAPAVIATHLMEILRSNCYKLLDRQGMQKMLTDLKETHSALVDGLVPDIISLGTIQKVLKNLLQEKIPVRNLIVILETIADNSAFSKDSEVLTEYVRQSLAETITDMLKNQENTITVAMFDPVLEDHIMNSIKTNGLAQNLGLAPDQVSALFQDIAEKVEEINIMGIKPALLVSPQIRRAVRKFLESVFSNVLVISYMELTPDTEVKSVGSIGYPNAS
ncbi:MAG: flagellar biosynthesis protein FlhA [Calditrichaeota bacterium]|nr:MAG: flagellar biosynthesis protein FlhA [Calditrichota bacterium]MBL1204022.1 flagellar biosynthesis protein FlhA [Calditrichota bacterium]NOG43853.1 flagellar biosynthesis protein FlhA [Calditrichota bacterium]